MLVEYWEDRFEDDPHAVLDAMRGADGEIVFDDLEDPLLAKWEQEMASGAVPDLEEGMSDREKKKLLVNDDFTKVAKQTTMTPPKVDKQYESKFVPVGSDMDKAMHRAATLGRASITRQPDFLGGVKRRGR